MFSRKSTQKFIRMQCGFLHFAKTEGEESFKIGHLFIKQERMEFVPKPREPIFGKKKKFREEKNLEKQSWEEKGHWVKRRSRRKISGSFGKIWEKSGKI